jgi:integrase
LRFVAEGMQIELDRSKADQIGAGAVVAVPMGTVPNLCPVTAVQAWLSRAGIAEGRVFRQIDRWGVIHGSLSDRAVAEIVKASVARLGLDPALFAGHSLRSGLATAAAANDAPAQVIMDHMRHARFDTTKRYIQQADRFRKNAARMAGL